MVELAIFDDNQFRPRLFQGASDGRLDLAIGDDPVDVAQRGDPVNEVGGKFTGIDKHGNMVR